MEPDEDKQENKVSINLGDQFTSFDDFQEIFKLFKMETNTEFCISDSRTLEASKKKYPLRVIGAPPTLKYYSVRYRCIRGGEFRSQSMGFRVLGTLKIGCKAHITLTLSSDSKALVISSLELEHNHETNEKIYIEVPPTRKRKLSNLWVKAAPSRPRKRYRRKQKSISQCTENEQPLQNLTNSNIQNTEMVQPDEEMHNLALTADPEVELLNPALSEPEVITRTPNDNDSCSLSQEEELDCDDHNELCKCGIGSFNLTKQDLMKMEVEEHYHRLEVLQLQKVYETERIEKMRYLYDLKIRLAEQELQNCNF